MRFLPSVQIKQRILQGILDGQFTPTQRMPPISRLAQIFNASTKTVQKAIHALTAEGVIEVRRGVGLFVCRRQCRQERGKRIGLLARNALTYLKGKPYPSQVVEPMCQALEAQGYSVVPLALETYDRMIIIESLAKERLSGLILFEVDSDSIISELRMLRLPMVSLDYDVYRHNISSVLMDNVHGAYLATQHLIELGHRRLVFLRPLLRNTINEYISLDAVEEERMKGYRLAMQIAGLEPLVEEYRNSLTGRRDALLGLMGRKHAPTGFVCPGDWVALDFLRGLEGLGFRIPDDMSVVGFGATRLDAGEGRQLTSVAVDYRAIGRAAAEVVADVMAEDLPRPVRRILPVSLELGATTGPAVRLAAAGGNA